MGLRTAMMFADLDRRCAQLPDRQEATRTRHLSRLVSEIVVFEVSRTRRFDPRASERVLKRSVDAGLRYIMERAVPKYQATIADLQEVARRIAGDADPPLRTADQEQGSIPLLPARSIPMALSRLFEWLASEAFSQMHPVEQMTICQARLCEIAPYSTASDTITSCFSCAFPWSRLGLLPLYEAHELANLYAALGDAVSLQTAPLVEINLKACQKACSLLAGQV